MRFVFILAGVSCSSAFTGSSTCSARSSFSRASRWRCRKRRSSIPKNIAVRLFRKFYPVTSHYDQGRFFTQDNGRRAATPLFLVLLIIETTDVAFALDSIPAVLAITSNAFIVFTSRYFRNPWPAFALLRPSRRHGPLPLSGVRAGRHSRVHRLEDVVTSIDVHIPIGLSLGVIAVVLSGSVLASLTITPISQGETAPAQES